MNITSIQNPRVKAAAQLRERRGRDEQERIIIDGVREIGRALAAGVKLVELYYFDELCHSAEHERLIHQASVAGTELFAVTPRVMEKLAFGNRVEGVVAVAQPPQRKLADLPLAADALLAVVEGVEKPGNLGAILRTADAAGLAGLIVADGGTDLYNPNTIRASLGAIFTVPVCQVGSGETLDWLRAGGFRLVAARVDGPLLYTQYDFRVARTAIVLGSEARGLGPQWQGDAVTSIKLPMLGRVDSLNLSATAAVLFYEALRQRQA
jgi:RNA methyltransferase, TrmH family